MTTTVPVSQVMSGMPSRPLAALHYFATDRSLPVADFDRAAAEHGFDAVLLPVHTHIPVCTESPYPGGGDLPERYRRTLDPYVALSAVAAQTDLEIGTCISLVAQLAQHPARWRQRVAAASGTDRGWS